MLAMPVGGTCATCSATMAAMTKRNDTPLSPKHATMPNAVSAAPGDQRSDHAREIELNRVERDRVGQVLFRNERRNQRLIGRPAERLRDAGDERERQDQPDADGAGEDERRQREGRRHLHALRHEQQMAAVAAIGDDAADEREEQDRDLADERIEAEEKGRGGAGERDDEPGLRDLLHPGADAGDERAEPEQAKVAIGQRRRDAAAGLKHKREQDS